MTDPLAEIVTLLRPTAALSKVVEGAGRWRLRRTDAGQPFYCVVLHGACHLETTGHDPVELETGGFVLIPAAEDFEVSSVEPPPPGHNDEPFMRPGGGVRLGSPDAPGRDLAQDVVDRGGHIASDTLDAIRGSAEAHGLSGDRPVGELLGDVKSGDLLGNVKQVAQETLQAGKDSAQTHLAGGQQPG